MNAEKYTKKSIEAINNARSIAAENKNQYLTPAHLLYSLLDQDGGLIGSIFTKMGTDTDAVLSELDTVINGLPRVSGGSGEVYASSETAASLDSAERIAKNMKDEYVSVEHIMLALFSDGGAEVRRILNAHGVTRQNFTAELAKVRSSPVTSDDPESTYDALSKYGSDLVERARSQKLDPVIGRDAEIRSVIRILSRKT
ncbi:MAG: type VI secretion system ATPase TssH, partial [Clostridia bacterium]|nr:type VI secretion system ATPase TssH [Clostridia bacterium]